MGIHLRKLLVKLKHLLLTQVFCTLVISSIWLPAHANNDGKIGSTSSASTQISVYVPHRYSVTSPTELIHNKVNKSPLCISHLGSSKDTNMGFKLTVDNISIEKDGGMTSSDDEALPFNIYLKNSTTIGSKKHLTTGVSIDMKSLSRSHDDFSNSCTETQIELQPTNGLKTSQANLGLLTVLVSPN